MKWNVDSIVVGVDGSETSFRAADLAAAMARDRNARLMIVTVVRTPEGWWGIGGAPPSPEALSEALVQGQQQILREVESRTNLSGVDYELVEELGEPVNRLLSICEENSADLLVIGRRGAGLAERVVLGSTADRLTHLSECPVLVVP